MTADSEKIHKTAVTMMAQQNYQKMKYYQQYKADRIRPVSPQGGFVLYCSKQGICTANSKYNSPKLLQIFRETLTPEERRYIIER